MTQSKTTRGFLKAKKGNVFKSQPDVTPERAFQLLKAKNPLKDKIKAWKGNTAFCDVHRFYTSLTAKGFHDNPHKMMLACPVSFEPVEMWGLCINIAVFLNSYFVKPELKQNICTSTTSRLCRQREAKLQKPCHCLKP